MGGRRYEIRRCRGNRRVCAIDVERDRSRLPPNGHCLDCNHRVAAVNQLQRLYQCWLGLERNHARTQTSECGNAVSHVCTDVEHEIARLNEFAVETVHRRAMLTIAVIDAQRLRNT